MLNNRFISFEGSEGVGKTTLVDKVAAYFEQHQTPYVRTREPGGTSFASQLRSILIDPNTDRNILAVGLHRLAEGIPAL